MISVLSSGSKGNSAYIKINEISLLVDCGCSYKYISNSLIELGISPSSIDYILITHTDSDHISGLKTFLSKNPCPVILSAEALKQLNYIKQYILITSNINVGIIIEPFMLSHDNECYGYLINNQVVYITDTGYINSKYIKKLSNKETYIIESNYDLNMLLTGKYPVHLKQRIISSYGHLSNEDTYNYLQQMISEKTKNIILTHLSTKNNNPEIIEKIYRKINKNIIISKELERTVLID